MQIVRFFLPLLFLALVLGACEDAANVGSDLIGAQGGQPVIEDITVSEFRSIPLVRPDNLAPRVLAGSVEDPLLGRYAVQGYFDVTPVMSDEFRSGTLESAELRLPLTYVYGDTTGEVTLALREITESWEADGLPTDTSFGVGPVLLEFAFDATDTADVVVELPESWVTENDEIVRGGDFGDLFHGFRLDPVDGNAVVGFGPADAHLVMTTSGGTSTSPMGRSYPHVTLSDGETLPPDRLLMQAGAGPALAFSLDIDETLPASAVNRAVVTLQTDTAAVAETPPDFVRPTLRTLDLFGVASGEEGDLLARATIDEEGWFSFESRALAQALQDRLMDRPTYEGFEIRIPNPNTPPLDGSALYYYTSLNPVIFFDSGAADKAPTASLTLTPLN